MNYFTHYQSPLGQITIQADGAGIRGLWLEIQKTQPRDLGELSNNNPHLHNALKQLREYFDGVRQSFDLKLSPKGTEFQKKVWYGLAKIPYGSTWSYQGLAEQIGCPTAVRAVGAANGKNPISIIVPCHRVVGKNGSLTGYAGGVEAKQWLLLHEQKYLS